MGGGWLVSDYFIKDRELLKSAKFSVKFIVLCCNMLQLYCMFIFVVTSTDDDDSESTSTRDGDESEGSSNSTYLEELVCAVLEMRDSHNRLVCELFKKLPPPSVSQVSSLSPYF